jgi:hypothetical protein
MNPDIWGPSTWFFLHTITLNYPNKPSQVDKLNYKKFFYSLKNIIPCTPCKHNYNIHITNLPIDNFLNNKNNLIKWLIHIHNKTNQHLNKPKFTFKQFISKYKSIYSKKNYTNYYYLFIFILFIIFILYILYILYIYNFNIKRSIKFP